MAAAAVTDVAAGSRPLRARRLEADALIFRPGLISYRDRDELTYSFDESWPPNAGLGFDGLAADDPSGAELRSPPAGGNGFVAASAADPGGAELCSLAPVEVSAVPASSAANAGAAPSNKVRTRASLFMGFSSDVSKRGFNVEGDERFR